MNATLERRLAALEKAASPRSTGKVHVQRFLVPWEEEPTDEAELDAETNAWAAGLITSGEAHPDDLFVCIKRFVIDDIPAYRAANGLAALDGPASRAVAQPAAPEAGPEAVERLRAELDELQAELARQPEVDAQRRADMDRERRILKARRSMFAPGQVTSGPLGL